MSDCTYIISWKVDPDNTDNIYYELRSKIPTHDIGFFALGWSTDKIMVNNFMGFIPRYLHNIDGEHVT